MISLRRLTLAARQRQIHKPLKSLVAPIALLAFAGTVAAFELSEPTSYEGTLPCADCPGIDWHLDLWPEGRFQLSREYQERGDSDDDLGRWRINPIDNSLLLYGSRGAPQRLAVIDPATLRLLAPGGAAIVSELPYELNRLALFTPTEITQNLRGEFRYLADAASFVECRTGHSYPVLMEGDYLNAERQYLATREDAGEPAALFLQLEGRIVNRRVMEPEGPPQSLRIERLVAALPNLSCERAMSQASLPST